MVDQETSDENKSSDKSLAERADDNFLRIVRSAGGAVRFIEDGGMRGAVRVAQTFKRSSRPAKAPPDEPKSGTTDPAPSTTKPSVPVALMAGVEIPLVDDLAIETPPTVAIPRPDPPTAQDEPERPQSRSAIDSASLLDQHPLGEALPVAEVQPLLDGLLHGTQTAHFEALNGLLTMGRSVAEPVFVAMLRDASPELAESALEGLSSLQSQRLRGCIAAVIASSDPQMRLAALRVAQRLPGDAARPFFVHAVLDSTAEVRRRAVLYLSWRDSDWASAALRALGSDSESSVKWAAFRALAISKPEEVRQLMAEEQESASPAYCRLMVRLVGESEPADIPEKADPPAASSHSDAIAPPPLAQKSEASSLSSPPPSDGSELSGSTEATTSQASDDEPATASAHAQKSEASSLSSDAPAPAKRAGSRARNQGRTQKK